MDQQVAARRAFYSVLKFWIACPTPRCRRWKMCAGDVDRCHALFWPVVPQEVKEWCRAAGKARRDRRSVRQAVRLADAAVVRWRSIQALERPKEEAMPAMPAPHSPPSPTPPSPRMRSV